MRARAPATNTITRGDDSSAVTESLRADPVAFAKFATESGWGDGLPLIPPTEGRVRELVANDVAAKKELQTAEAEYARVRAEHARTQERLRLYGGGEATESPIGWLPDAVGSGSSCT